ncbi:hypothetical protein ACFL0Q_01845 [Thermodesulfobacteriota bacterium]
MAADFLEKEVTKARDRFNETLEPLAKLVVAVLKVSVGYYTEH